MSENIKFSILIPCYNVQQSITKSLNSCFNQTYRNFQVIVCDNGSTDKTVNILGSFNKKQLIYFSSKNKQNLNEVRNFLINQASGDYIVWLQAYDALNLNFLKKCFECIKEKDYDIIEVCSALCYKQRDNIQINLNSYDYFGENCLKFYLEREDLTNNILWGKAIKKQVMKKTLVDQNIPISLFDEAYYVLNIYKYANSYKSLNTDVSLYYYYGDYARFNYCYEINYDSIKNAIDNRVMLLNYAVNILKQSDLYDQYKLTYFEKLQVLDILNNILNIDDKEERNKILEYFYKYFFIHVGAISLTEEKKN